MDNRLRVVIATLICLVQTQGLSAQSPPAFELEPNVTAASEAAKESESNSDATASLPSSLKLLITMSIFSLAPALLMMTTCFVRFAIVFGLLKQAIGTPNIPPAQVMTALSLFLTFLVMSPVWKTAYDSGVEPYLQPPAGTEQLTEYEAFTRAMVPIRDFMGDQIEQNQNQDAVWMFWDYHSRAMAKTTSVATTAELTTPQNYQDLPLSVLFPAYLVSELKTAFLIGFQIFLPFLVIDLLVSSVLTSSGLMMLPPTLVSLPFKLMLFVLIDGWMLIVGTMLESIRPFTG